jgi:multicomponent Na+:H+ antiporter subunit D
MSGLHPAFVLFATALLVAILRGMLRPLVLVLGIGLTVWAQLQLSPQTGRVVFLPDYGLQLLYIDKLSHVFGLIFVLITAIGVCYALHVKRGGEPSATLVYAGAALGVVFAGDWLSLFVFWELMAIASLCVIWYGGTQRSWAAGFRYLLVHMLGGSLLLCGILLHLHHGAELPIQALTAAPGSPDAALWLMLLGIAINAAIPPLHAWLTDAYPEASVTGSVFLSAFTTKTAVYVLVRLFAGAEILVWAGVVMTLYGVIFAILEKDIRRLLSYHIVSQVGYMVTGVGIGTALALNGAVAHAFCHILYKALLFMGAGAVIQATGKRQLTELGGLSHHMWLVSVLYMIGALSISGVPFFNGFISKSMIVSAAAEAHRPIAELLLTLAGVGTFLSIALKLAYFTFCGPTRGIQPQPLPRNMLLAMLLASLPCLALGLFPDWLYARLPFTAEYHPYTVDHVVSALQLLLGTCCGFWLLLARLSPTPGIHLDTDWLYRRPLAQGVARLITTAHRAGATLESGRTALLRIIIPYVHNPFLTVRRLGPGPRTLPTAPPVNPAGHTTVSSRREDSFAYNEDTFRLPIGATIFWIVVFFVCVALYTI